MIPSPTNTVTEMTGTFADAHTCLRDILFCYIPLAKRGLLLEIEDVSAKVYLRVKTQISV